MRARTHFGRTQTVFDFLLIFFFSLFLLRSLIFVFNSRLVMNEQILKHICLWNPLIRGCGGFVFIIKIFILRFCVSMVERLTAIKLRTSNNLLDSHFLSGIIFSSFFCKCAREQYSITVPSPASPSSCLSPFRSEFHLKKIIKKKNAYQTSLPFARNKTHIQAACHKFIFIDMTPIHGETVYRKQ